MLFSVSVVCWCKHCVLWVNSVWHLKSSTTDWLKLKGVWLGCCWCEFLLVYDLCKICKFHVCWFLVVETCFVWKLAKLLSNLFHMEVCVICSKIPSIYWHSWDSETLCFCQCLWYCVFYKFACVFLCCIICLHDLCNITRPFICEIFNSSVIMLNCCRIMVDWSCGCVMLVVGVLPMLLLVMIGVFEVASAWVSLGRSLWFCECDSPTIVSKALNSGGSAGGNVTIIIVMSYGMVISNFISVYPVWLVVILGYCVASRLL